MNEQILHTTNFVDLIFCLVKKNVQNGTLFFMIFPMNEYNNYFSDELFFIGGRRVNE